MDKIIQYYDDRLSEIKKEITRLENEIIFISNEIADVEKIIYEFGIKQSREIGEILVEILKARKEKSEREQNGSETKKREYEEAKHEYEKYNQEYQDNILEEQFKLTDDEKNELKTKYRRASKLCHPDMVKDELKEQAEIVFKELRKAYEKGDLKRITEILEMLEKGDMLIKKSQEITVKELLEVEAFNLQNKLIELKKHLDELKGSELFKSIILIEDWDEYFMNIKQKLIYELKNI